MKASIEYAVQQTTRVAADHFEAATRVPELMLVEILGLHLASAPAASQGLARAIRDPVLSPALAAIHGSPAEKWTVGSLAQQAHVSISLLDERFREVLGLAPIRRHWANSGDVMVLPYNREQVQGPRSRG